ncbi:hypothetical protein ACFFLM_21240 [Deinococcus oregonensis]|uniref:Uncharacterized protein n=1 Tax=Deinococcus oregonensis TaxID=1805970 RepID=A0ABV6B402_9DEIO
MRRADVLPLLGIVAGMALSWLLNAYDEELTRTREASEELYHAHTLFLQTSEGEAWAERRAQEYEEAGRFYRAPEIHEDQDEDEDLEVFAQVPAVAARPPCGVCREAAAAGYHVNCRCNAALQTKMMTARLQGQG